MFKIYGSDSSICQSNDKNSLFIFSHSKTLDLIELEQLLLSVGWSNRPMQRVRKALDNSLIKVGLWRHDQRFPRLIGFARCAGDGILEVTIWDVAINPIYQGYGFGKQLMKYILNELRKYEITRVTLFADPGVIEFYKNQGWRLETRGNKCAFWYAN